MTTALDDLPQPEHKGTVDPDSLETDGDNPNEMTDEQFGLLCDRMRQNGWLGGPIITDSDGLIADGQHRWQAAQEIGLSEVPVKQFDIDDATRRLWRQELNKIHGEHDTKRDALEYDYLLDNGKTDEVHALTNAADEDLDELLREIKLNNEQPVAYEYDPEHNVYFEDCVEGMQARLDDDSVDMVFTSPPYNVEKSATEHRTKDTVEYDDDMEDEEYREFLQDVFAEIARVVKDDGHVFINHQNHYMGGNVDATTWIMDAMPMTAKSYICWFKGDQSSMSHMSQSGRFYPAWEPIYHFSESGMPLQNTTINDHWDIRAAVGGTADSEASAEHPAPYPVELPKRAMRATCDDGALVLDPFMGSGTTAVAAVEYGCDYVGFELDEEGAYKPIIERRIGEAKRQVNANQD